MQVVVTGARPSLALYDVNGLTKIRNLTTAEGVQWEDPLGAGSISFVIPTSDADDLTPGRWVKVFWRPGALVAARIKTWSTEWAVDGISYREFKVIPGALASWNDATCFPEYPLNQRTTGSERTFGPMSRYISSTSSSWYVASQWHAAQGVRWSATPGVKHRQPEGLSGPNPYWIAKTYPFPTVPGDETQWFRRTFTTYAGFTYKIYASADNYLTLYLDGEQIITPDQQNGHTWHTLVEVSGILQPGKHLLAAKAQNAFLKAGHNPVGLIFAMVRTDSKDNPVKGPPLLMSDSSWLVTDADPGWHAALVPWQLHAEAVARRVRACQYLGVSWTPKTDSAGQAWTDHGTYSVDIGQMGLADIAAQQAESHFDLHVNAATMKVGAYKRLGSDKHASVELKLGKDGGSLMSFVETVNKTRFTKGLLHLNDGTWIVRQDDDAVTEYGPVEIGVSLGSTPDADTATEVFDAAFSDAANPQQSFTVEISTLTGPQPYIHIFPGDSIKIPNPDVAGTLKVRVLSISGDASAPVVRAFLQVVVDHT